MELLPRNERKNIMEHHGTSLDRVTDEIPFRVNSTNGTEGGGSCKQTPYGVVLVNRYKMLDEGSQFGRSDRSGRSV